MKPSSRTAAVPSASSRALNSGSAQARATTRAPFAGDAPDSEASMISSSRAPESTPFSSSSVSSRRTRRAIVASAWSPLIGRTLFVGFQIALPQIQYDVVVALAPQVAGREPDGVDLLDRRVPAALRADVGEFGRAL